ncbi:MAG: hypothetical protein P1P78_14565 [Methyloprofundus sp.]|nr:hypothetical protein [Methyloprofundus sp.]
MDNIPENYTSKKFAVGWRRFIDWPDWIKPAGWHQEHDILHHYNLGERLDPDHLQHNLEWLRESKSAHRLALLISELIYHGVENSVLHTQNTQRVTHQ